MSKVSNAFQNLAYMSSLAGQIEQEAQAAENIFNVFSLPAIIANITSQVTQIALSLPNDIATLTTGIPVDISEVTACANNVAANAGQQLDIMVANVQSCIDQSG